MQKFKPIKERLYTMTSDKGKEFAEHKQIAKDLGIDWMTATFFDFFGNDTLATIIYCLFFIPKHKKSVNPIQE
ncbi:MAG: hypothetical protein LBN11_00265 [Tannerella sp.]|jgi:hypothetical protein|nr:hypothetical protein [Tannerella sp.]